MLLYLSSYKLWNKKDILKKWIKENGNTILIIANSRDWSPDTDEKEESIKRNITELQELGFSVVRIDLRNYFKNKAKLKEDLEKYNAFYVIGGNTYTLRMAMKYSGFDEYIKGISIKKNYLYSGYSAGICVLSQDLRGLDLVDEPLNPYTNEPVLYDGLGILDYVPVPHYKSDHPESALVDKVVNFFNEKGIKYKALKDGEVIVQDTEKERSEWVVKIESKRLILRNWEDGDVKDIVDGLNNLEVSKWMASVPYPYTENDAKNFIERAKNNDENVKIALAIVLKENNKVIGGTEIRNINKKDGTAGGGIWLNEKYQKNGYGTEAFSARNKYCFYVLGLRRIENGYFPNNEKSRKMQMKLATNEFVDECVTGLLKEEFIEWGNNNEIL